MKKSMIVFYEWFESFEDLTDEEVGQLMLAIYNYDKDRTETEFSDRTLKVIYKRMKSGVDENNKRYEETCKQNAENGKKGGRPKKTETEKSERFSEKPTESDQNRTKAKKADNDNEYDNDNKYKSKNKKDSLSYEREVQERESVFDFFRENNFRRHPQEFIDYNIGIGRDFSDPVKWQAWARLWEAKKNE